MEGQPLAARIDFGLGVVTSPPAIAHSNKLGAGPHYLSLSFSKAVDDSTQPNNETEIDLYLPSIIQPGTYVLDQTPGPLNVYGGSGTPAYASFTYRKLTLKQVLLTGPATPGQLVVTRYDLGAGVVSGTFEFTASSPRPGPPCTSPRADSTASSKALSPRVLLRVRAETLPAHGPPPGALPERNGNVSLQAA